MPIKLPFQRRDNREKSYPPDLWTKCPDCGEMLYNKQLEKNLRVCTTCGHHFRLRVDARLAQLLDERSFDERDGGLESLDPLGFVDHKAYPDRVAAARVATGLRDAAVWGFGTIDETRVAVCVMDFAFMGGSMGSVVGEKVARAAEGALAERVPLIVVASSGGARMQEGTLALMQLAKTVAALGRLQDAGVPYISLLADPTTGGVFASFAALGDVNVAEPKALIGFAGARVSAGTISETLPDGFQRAEFLLDHGFVDMVVKRHDLKARLAELLRYLRPAARPMHPVFEPVTGALGGAAGGTWNAQAPQNGTYPANGTFPPARAGNGTGPAGAPMFMDVRATPKADDHG
jgi:acetyl-CoA carboxylase carboxyl transferase subunit beta